MLHTPTHATGDDLVLTYFSDNKGRNELSRLIFAIGNVDYVNEEIDHGAYLTRRGNGELPYDQIPTLRVGSFVIGQSCAIARFAARKAGLYPKDEMQAAIADAVVDQWRDQLDLFYDTVFAREIIGGKLMMFPRKAAERQPKLSSYIEVAYKPTLAQYERQLTVQTDGAPHFSTEGLSFADVAVYDLIKTLATAIEEAPYKAILEPYPKLQALVRSLDARPEIVEHLEKHPYKSIHQFFKPPSAAVTCGQTCLWPCLKMLMGLMARHKSKNRE
mmetsp:Transcript_56643/g.104863  ORF Transcript_56643/g.104863 Transcript_56643/m.104863 type:complete len:273 (-) Transcript_56643:29-847(-)